MDGGIESLGHGIGDPVLEVGEQAEQVLLERDRDLLDGCKLAAPGLLIPLVKVKVRLRHARTFPEPYELDAVVVGPGRAQVLIGQRLEGRELLPA